MAIGDRYGFGKGDQGGDPFQGATATVDGLAGYVPTPLAGQEEAVLKGNGTWDNFKPCVFLYDLEDANVGGSSVSSRTIPLNSNLMNHSNSATYINNHPAKPTLGTYGGLTDRQLKLIDGYIYELEGMVGWSTVAVVEYNFIDGLGAQVGNSSFSTSAGTNSTTHPINKTNTGLILADGTQSSNISLAIDSTTAIRFFANPISIGSYIKVTCLGKWK